MSINVNPYTGYIYCAGINKNGSHCSMPVKSDGDFCARHKNQAVDTGAEMKED